MWFGIGNGEIAPFEPVEVMLPYDEKKKVTCFDIVQLSSDIVVVDCILYIGKEILYDNYFYIVNRLDFERISEFKLPTYIASKKIMDRKSLAYYGYNTTTNSTVTFMVSGLLFDSYDSQSPEDLTFLEIYKYNSAPKVLLPQGSLESSPPITGAQLGINDL